MLEGLTHTLFGCNPKDITSTSERIICTKCHSEWFKNPNGRWVDHEERPWEILCLRN